MKELPSLEVEGSRYTNHHQVQKHPQREAERNLSTRNIYEEREGETSGYASDSIEAPIPQTADIKSQLIFFFDILIFLVVKLENNS